MTLEVRIKKRFENFFLDVEFSAADGITGLLGASGCGKSMTLKCIAGIVTPDEGRIALDGRVLFDSKKKINIAPQKRRVGYLFQHYALFPNMTVAENIAAGVRDKAERGMRVADMVRAFYLNDLENKYPRQLSGGQQQRVALARILASGPEVLLLDEPLSALDSYLRWQVEMELSELLKSFSGPVVYVTHSREEVYRLCTRVCVLNHGSSQPMQSVKALFDSPSTLSACILSGCKNVSRARPVGDEKVEALDWGITLETGRKVPADITHVGVQAHYITPRAASGENLIPCKIEKVVEDVFSTVVILTTPGGTEGFSRLNMELDKLSWLALGDPPALTVGIAPQNIIFLKK